MLKMTKILIILILNIFLSQSIPLNKETNIQQNSTNFEDIS